MIRWKEWLEELYAAHSRLLGFAGRTILGLLIFSSLCGNTGYRESLNSPAVLLGLSVLCGVLPAKATLFLAFLYTAAQLYALSPVALLAGGGLLLILLLLYAGLAPEDDRSLLLAQASVGFSVPLAAPLVYGLTGGGTSVLGILCGTAWSYVLQAVRGRKEALAGLQMSLTSAADLEQVLSETGSLLNGILRNRSLVLALAAALAAWLAVWAGRRLVIKYAWTVAIAAGCIVYLAVRLGGAAMLDVGHTPAFYLGLLGSAAIALAVQFLLFTPDYRRAEAVQFEDDAYYYYVTAVPKRRSRAQEE